MELLKHKKKVAKHNQIMLHRIRLPANIPFQMFHIVTGILLILYIPDIFIITN